MIAEASVPVNEDLDRCIRLKRGVLQVRNIGFDELVRFDCLAVIDNKILF